MENLWILTEERPKKEVLKVIIEKLCSDKRFNVEFKNLVIKPIIRNKRFVFAYELFGVNFKDINRIFIKNVSGRSSFVDFLIFLQEKEPKKEDTPIYAIEETKTDDSESRNTGVYQRCSKFVFVDLYYPDCKKVMLYNLKVESKSPTKTNIFGTRMLLKLGIEILGKKLDGKIFKKFSNIDELIRFKSNMRKAPKGNVPIEIIKNNDSIKISGRLIKSGSLSHDPNIGALSIISKTLRELGWKKKIIITKHGLSQRHLKKRNKFIRIANELKLELEGLKIPKSELHEEYWYYDETSEKVATIFLHLILEELKDVKSIYENHAGCERGYFHLPNGKYMVIHKYIENTKSKGKIPKLPDLIVLNKNDKEILNLEGKNNNEIKQGIDDIKQFDVIEEEYIKPNYKDYKIIRGVVIYGGKDEKINNKEVIFLLNSEGKVIISKYTPKIILKALKNAS